MSGKSWKIIRGILLLGSFLAALKLIFVDYTLDEEYQIVMAYRHLNGDMLFREMWEPGQTSAFLCIGLMWLYRAVTGTLTGVVLFLRFVTVGVQLALAWSVYRTLLRFTQGEYAFLLAVLYFNIVPKNIQIPEYSNMQLWFLTVCILLLMQYFHDLERDGADRWYLLVCVGIALSGEVLAYPTCIILFPFFLAWIFAGSGKKRWRNGVILTVVCAVCGGLWLMVVLQNVSVREFSENVVRLVSFDATHAVTGITEIKTHTYVDNLVLWGVWLVVTAAVSGLITLLICRILKKRNRPVDGKTGRLIWLVTAVMTAECIQIYYWVVRGIGYEYLQIHLLLVWLAAALVWSRAGGCRRTLFWGVAGTLVAYAGVMYISDLTFYYALPHGALGIVFAVAVIISALEKEMGGTSARRWAYLLVVSLCLCCIFGKGYTLRGGKSNNTILKIAGIMKEGPAAGILSDYMGAYIYNTNYGFFRENLEQGENVLIVVNIVLSAGTTAYLFDDYGVCHYSVIDPTCYDERLLEYWERYPEKKPDVIVVDCWFGDLQESPDSWIMRYIEEDFGYSEIRDGSYVRFYVK